MEWTVAAIGFGAALLTNVFIYLVARAKTEGRVSVVYSAIIDQNGRSRVEQLEGDVRALQADVGNGLGEDIRELKAECKATRVELGEFKTGLARLDERMAGCPVRRTDRRRTGEKDHVDHSCEG